MMFFNLNDAISEAGTRSLGFTGADLDALNATAPINSTGHTAIDQIGLSAGVTPNVVHTTWIVDMYASVAELAMVLFWIFFIAGLCAMLLKSMGSLPASISAATMHMLKKTIVAAFMISYGLPIIMTMLLTNQWISETFGGAMTVTSIMVMSITSPLGCVIVAGGCVAILWNAVFYMVRMVIILISCGIWPIAWVLWMFGRTSRFAVFLLTIIVVNIFLGAAMCLVYWVGTLFLTSSEAASWLSGWGVQMCGLLIMAIAGVVPILAFAYFIANPTPFVKKIMYTAAL